MSVDLSLIIPTLGRPDTLAAVLASLARQETGDIAVELLVVHDGGPKAPPIELPSLPWPARILAHRSNRGRAAACNTGAGAAGGRILLFLDDDFVPERTDFLAGHHARHAREVLAVIGGVKVARLPGESLWSRSHRLGAAQAEAERHRRLEADPFDCRYAWTGNFSLPAACFKGVSGFDASYRVYGFEDTDLALRLVAAGTPLRHAPDLSVMHLSDAVSATVLARKSRMMGRNAVRIRRAHPGYSFPFGFDPEPYARACSRARWRHRAIALSYPALMALVHAADTLGLDALTPRIADRVMTYWKGKGLLEGLGEKT